MILLDMKNSKATSSPLGLSVSKEKPLASFADLLRGASDKKESKVIQNGSLVLALDAQNTTVKTPKNIQKTENLASVLKMDEKILETNEVEFLELNPKLMATLTQAEIKTVINDAKNYLKEKIQSSEGYKNAEIKELPKTLGSLIEVAKKMGIDITKITLEEVKETSFVEEQKSDLPQKGISLDGAKTDKEPLKDRETLIKEMPIEKTHNIKQEHFLNKQDNTLKETPLFQAQSQHVATEQLVQAKANNLLKPEHKETKERSDEPLKLLLSDDSSLSNTLMSHNISQIAAKEAQSASNTESIKTLEQLLNGESSSSETNQTTIKTEAFATHKADSLEVKINEAKQMIRYLSDDIKSAIDDYKSPFTRVKVQLNPQHLGEVDLTVIQRGKNLHVNITSNNNAINTLAMNVNELRVQLNNSGINNATFHFNENQGQGFTDGGNSNQHRGHEHKRAHEEYSYFEEQDINEEILSSLEIIVPQYI